jgi:hypothetical protein
LLLLLLLLVAGLMQQPLQSAGAHSATRPVSAPALLRLLARPVEASSLQALCFCTISLASEMLTPLSRIRQRFGACVLTRFFTSPVSGAIDYDSFLSQSARARVPSPIR